MGEEGRALDAIIDELKKGCRPVRKNEQST